MSTSPAEAIEIFYSYSHEDEELRIGLEKHLSNLKHQGAVTGWHDRQISAGSDWADTIDQHLNSADVILLLISSDFLASDYCYGREMTRALERHRTGSARVVPVLLRECDWQGAPFGRLQALPPDAKPVTIWADRDQAFTAVVNGIRKVAVEIRDQLGAKGTAPDERFNNLPVPPTPFVGRQSEVAMILDHLRHGDVRLVVLTGSGGAGKSRLAQQVARNLAKSFTDGVCIVFLERINNPELIHWAIAQALGVQEDERVPVRDALKQYLEPRHMLLLLDNFEHVAVAAKYVAELLAACPHLKAMLTSRRLIRIRGARNFQVPPLAVPERGRHLQAHALTQYDAVKLFIQSARVVVPDFAVTDENAPAVAEICVRLEGSALAIELAAARINKFSPQEMLEELEKELETKFEGGGDESTIDLFGKGLDDMPERQRSMRATIAWSYDLLEEAEKVLFRRLAIFAGGCSPEAVKHVCNAAGDLKINLREGLDSLVENNLLRRDEVESTQHRFRMLDMIREYGIERLRESGEREISGHHAKFFAALAEEAEAKIPSPGRDNWLECMEREHYNLQAALRWCQSEEGDIELGLQITGALFWFWNLRSHFSEGRAWVEGMLKRNKDLRRREALAKALYCAGGLAFLQGDDKASLPRIRESVAIWRELGDERRLGYALVILGMVALNLDDLATALASEEESIKIFRKLKDEDEWGYAVSHNDLGNVYRMKGDYHAAQRLYKQSLSVWRKINDSWGLPLTLSNVGFLEMLNGHYEPARRALEEALKVQREADDRLGLSKTLKYLGDLAVRTDDYEKAETLYYESLRLNKELGHKQFMVACLAGLAVVAGKTERPEYAARLSGAVDALRNDLNVSVKFIDIGMYGPVMEVLQSHFEDVKKFKREHAIGQKMGLGYAVEYALLLAASV